MSDLTVFLLDRLDEDPAIERSIHRAVDAARATPGGEPVALIGLHLREWDAVEARTNDDWRGLIKGIVRAHESVLNELLPDRVGVADSSRMAQYEAYALVLRHLAVGYADHPDFREEWWA